MAIELEKDICKFLYRIDKIGHFSQQRLRTSVQTKKKINSYAEDTEQRLFDELLLHPIMYYTDKNNKPKLRLVYT